MKSEFSTINISLFSSSLNIQDWTFPSYCSYRLSLILYKFIFIMHSFYTRPSAFHSKSSTALLLGYLAISTTVPFFLSYKETNSNAIGNQLLKGTISARSLFTKLWVEIWTSDYKLHWLLFSCLCSLLRQKCYTFCNFICYLLFLKFICFNQWV